MLEQKPYPQGYYVYAYLDSNEPFYIGKGRGKRAWMHLHQDDNTPFHVRLNTIRDQGNRPEILILRDGMTQEEALSIEADLIYLIGSQIMGTGPLCNIAQPLQGISAWDFVSMGVRHNRAIKCWDEMFPTLTALARDPRCIVSISTVRNRLLEGWSIEDAAETPILSTQITCWSEEFSSLTALVDDARCVVSMYTVRNRLLEGWSIEEAVETPPSSTQITCWGEEFSSLTALVDDARCVVSMSTIRNRLHEGWPIEEAVETRAGISKGIPIICWGEEFPSIPHLSRDPRCLVGDGCLFARIHKGILPEEAAETPLMWSRPLVNRPPDWNLD